MRELVRQEITDCSCGRIHRCPIKEIVIGKEAIGSLPAFLAEYGRPLLVFDTNTLRACGEAVKAELDKAGCAYDSVLFSCKEGELVIPNEQGISWIETAMKSETKILVGVGSGVINDLCKYVSFHHGLPYIIVATATSMDGYASSGAAMILAGMKVTVPCRPPIAVFADPQVLRNAPEEMIAAGAGDIIGKYSSLIDWRLGALIRKEAYCAEMDEMTMKEVRQVTEDLSLIRERDADAIGRLMHSLVQIGVAMAYVGNSRPGSGSEHHLSHFYEITGIVRNRPYLAHGIDVGYAAYLTIGMRHFLAAQDPKTFTPGPTLEVRTPVLREVYGPLSDEILSLQEKTGFYREDRMPRIKEKWEEIRALLETFPTAEEYLAMLKTLGFRMEEFRAFYGEDYIRESILYAKDLKERYTLLNLLADVGLLDTAADTAIKALA